MLFTSTFLQLTEFVVDTLTPVSNISARTGNRALYMYNCTFDLMIKIV